MYQPKLGPHSLLDSGLMSLPMKLLQGPSPIALEPLSDLLAPGRALMKYRGATRHSTSATHPRTMRGAFRPFKSSAAPPIVSWSREKSTTSAIMVFVASATSLIFKRVSSLSQLFEIE